MDLYDYQIKQIFEENGIPVLKGCVAYTPAEAQEVAERIGGTKWFVKAQMCGVYESLKDKTDACRWVAVATDPSDVFNQANRMLKDVFETDIGPQTVKKVYVEEACQIAQKIRISVQVDFEKQMVVFVLENQKGKMFRFPVPEKGITNGFLYQCLTKMDIAYRDLKKVCHIIQKLYQLFLKYEAVAVEINPMVLTLDHQIVALEGRILFDPDTLFKYPDIARMKEGETGREREMMAKQNNFKYITLNGNIACLVNGSGLGLATIDLIHACQGEVACLLDVGTEPSKETVAKAFRLVLSEPDIEGVLVNIFGGTTRCDIIAKGLIAAAQEIAVGMPIVVRMDGTNAQIGERFLIESGLPFVITHTMKEAIAEIVQKVQALS